MSHNQSINETSHIRNTTDMNSTKDDIDINSQYSDNLDDDLDITQIPSKIVEMKIVSSLIFSKLLYFNWFYMFICFVFQISAVLFKFYISSDDIEDNIQFILVVIWFIAKLIGLRLGNNANIQGDVIY